jgi:hypothetical protein
LAPPTRTATDPGQIWLGLVFATQFPQHLPGELYPLCNNRILLRLGDEPTIHRLKHSVGGVPEVAGPLCLRHSSHFGLGMFVAEGCVTCAAGS